MKTTAHTHTAAQIAYGQIIPPSRHRLASKEPTILVLLCPYCGHRHLHGWPGGNATPFRCSPCGHEYELRAIIE
jgi:DNA-directed RNA polymerase subunit RPC12/RpoP